MGSLRGREKAAILLGYIGEAAAAEVLRMVDKDIIKRITLVMSEVKTLKRDEVNSVLDEVKNKISEDVISIGGKEYAQRVLNRGLGEKDARKLLESTKQATTFDRLNGVDPKVIANFLAGEHPQTIAFTLSLLDPKSAAEILPLLPDDLKGDIAIRIANLERIPDDALKELEEVLKTQLNITEAQGRKVQGVKAVADILNNAAKDTEQMILEMIDEHEPNVAESIRALMFVFEDIVDVDDRAIQSILKEISTNDLALALKTATDQLKGKIFKNMSQRAVLILKEEMETMGPVRVSDVEQAQKNIVKVVRNLEEEGKIIIASKGGEELIV
ncbi:flagellar motor switch protein FliG [bacterium BMS3Bbin06]|nr:flagellar motor switch protein FliG [bacterium BMS3Abin08]GBE33839.1 flagellar motor switch protein FliG [bacterium BMS3Bbin06]HDO36639.1 flagellar motor switch protein FliG [Nitrospirota bacterium]HDY72509.1 flagellar motor switch protein FliG [Nitrospirota bacterium]